MVINELNHGLTTIIVSNEVLVTKEYYLVIDAYAEVASYRVPEYHNFHKTLPLPPPTAIIGLVGAALGLSPQMSQKWFDENDIDIGIHGTYQGIYSDLWKISSSKKETDSSIVKREYLFKNHYQLVIGGTMEIVNRVSKAFKYNKYALTAGNSDSLLKINFIALATSDMVKNVCSIANTMLIGNFRPVLSYGIDKIEINKVYRYSKLISPITYNLPFAFDYETDETRRIRFRKEVTFVGTRSELKDGITIPALIYNDVAIPIFSYS